MLRYRATILMIPFYGLIVAGILYHARPVEATVIKPRLSRAIDVGAQTTKFSNDNSALLRVVFADQKNSQSAPATLPEGKGKDLAQKDCGTCHATNVWTNQHHTRDQWSSIIDNMVSKGLHASDDDLDTITDYLAANFGPAKSTPPAGSVPSPNASPGAPASLPPSTSPLSR